MFILSRWRKKLFDNVKNLVATAKWWNFCSNDRRKCNIQGSLELLRLVISYCYWNNIKIHYPVSLTVRCYSYCVGVANFSMLCSCAHLLLLFADISDGFADHLQVLMPKLFSSKNLSIKRFARQQITASDLYDLFTRFTEQFNKFDDLDKLSTFGEVSL